MKRVVVIAMCVLAVVSAPAQAHHRCASSADSRTAVSDSAVRLFEKRGLFYLCQYATGKKRLVGPKSQRNLDTESIRRFRLSGRFLAYERFFATFRGDPQFSILVRDTRTGRLIRRISAAYNAAEVDETRGDAELRDGVRDLVMSTAGAVAWILHNPYTAGPRTQVHRFDGQGQTLVEASDSISETSLTLAGRTVSYLKGTRRKSFELAASPLNSLRSVVVAVG